MIGLTQSEMIDALENYHEIEFEYCNQKYFLQPEQNEGINRLIIGIESNGEYVIAASNYDHSIDKACIDILLNMKCFNEKSFNDISNEVTVVAVY